MKHVPHVVVAAPWPEGRLPLTVVQWRHLTKVLRRKQGEPITYTDGLGTFGTGIMSHQEIERGEEVMRRRGHELTVAVAPPSNKDRQRFLVEKLAELGVARLIWLETRHGANRVSSSAKVFSWMLAAVEQSRGAWLMETSGELLELSDLDGRVVVCHPGGDETPDGEVDVIVIGPEGGFAEDELPSGYERWGLGETILRVETAAIASVARLSLR